MFLKTSLKGCFQNQQNYKCLKLTNVIGILMGSYLFIDLVFLIPFSKNKQNIFYGLVQNMYILLILIFANKKLNQI